MFESLYVLESFFYEGDLVAASLVCTFLFVLGAIWASFSCLVAYRLTTLAEGRSILSTISYPPSYCESCGRKLSIIELIPVIGWVLCRGRCLTCGAKIPARYPLMELLLGFACASTPFFMTDFWAAFAATFVLLSGFMIAVIDWENSMVPEELTWVLLFTGLIASPIEIDIQFRVIGAAIGAGLAWSMTTVPGWIRGIDTRAWGDVAMAAGVGAWLGCFLIAPVCVAAAVIQFAVCLFLGREENGGTWSPFGPALMASFAVSLPTYPLMIDLLRPSI
jgi:Type II secretory pathway, prepilin signal peptidase PulO and related peptidases